MVKCKSFHITRRHSHLIVCSLKQWREIIPFLSAANDKKTNNDNNNTINTNINNDSNNNNYYDQ